MGGGSAPQSATLNTVTQMLIYFNKTCIETYGIYMKYRYLNFQRSACRQGFGAGLFWAGSSFGSGS